jgi:hypothetical protein
MPSSNYLRGKIIDAVYRATSYSSPATVYVALHTADPTVAGIAGTEVSGGWYGRQSAAFAAQATPGESSNSATITFSAVSGSAVIVTHFSIWDASTLGNMLSFAALSASKTFNPSDVPSWLAGSLTLSLA